MSGETEKLINGATTEMLGGEHATVKALTPPIAPLETIISTTSNVERPTLEYELSPTLVSLPRGKPCRIVLQSSNGPCALIALANSLLLRGTLVLTGNTNIVGNEQLLEALGNTLVNLHYDKKTGVEASEDSEGIIDSVSDCLHKMQFGMCVDPRFGDSFSFSAFKESVLFELVGVRLCHAMVVEGRRVQRVAG